MEQTQPLKPPRHTHAHLMITSPNSTRNRLLSLFFFLRVGTFFCHGSIGITNPFICASGWQVRETKSCVITAGATRVQTGRDHSKWFEMRVWFPFSKRKKKEKSAGLFYLTSCFNDILAPSPHLEERQNKENEGLRKFNTNSLQLL